MSNQIPESAPGQQTSTQSSAQPCATLSEMQSELTTVLQNFEETAQQLAQIKSSLETELKELMGKERLAELTKSLLRGALDAVRRNLPLDQLQPVVLNTISDNQCYRRSLPWCDRRKDPEMADREQLHRQGVLPRQRPFHRHEYPGCGTGAQEGQNQH